MSFGGPEQQGQDVPSAPMFLEVIDAKSMLSMNLPPPRPRTCVPAADALARARCMWCLTETHLSLLAGDEPHSRFLKCATQG